MEPVRHIILDPEGCGCNREEFQSIRRQVADAQSSSDIYIVADDDCLPQQESFVEQAAKTLRINPAFGVLSLWPENANIVRWTPEDYEPMETDEVLEHVSVGGIRFCRKGLLDDWPEKNRRGYDMEHSVAMRKEGYRVGYYKTISMKHLGEGKTTVWI